jgi:hypothetical protein
MKRTLMAILLVISCLVVENAFADSLRWIPRILFNTEDLVGAKFQSFGNTADPELYVGIPSLLLPANRQVADGEWAEFNQLTFIFDRLNDRLIAKVSNIKGDFSKEFYNVSTEIQARGKKFTINDLDFLQITIVNRDTKTTVNLNDVFINYEDSPATISLGSFGGNGRYDWSVKDPNLKKGFTLTGKLHLIGSFGAIPALSMLEIKAGHKIPNKPPDCSKAYASPSMLWPPSHKFIKINVIGVTDPEGEPITISINRIFQDEPVQGIGDGNTKPDGVGVGSPFANVRAERDGSGNGRVYHIGFTADDGLGGVCTGEVHVGVPKSMGKNGNPVDNGALYDSTAN